MVIFFHTDYMYIKRALAIYYLIYNLKKHSINKNFNLIFVWLLQWQKQFQLFHEFFTIQLVVSYLFVHIYFFWSQLYSKTI